MRHDADGQEDRRAGGNGNGSLTRWVVGAVLTVGLSLLTGLSVFAFTLVTRTIDRHESRITALELLVAQHTSAQTVMLGEMAQDVKEIKTRLDEQDKARK